MVGGKRNVLVHYVNAGSPDQAVVVVVCVVVCDFVCMFTFKLFSVHHNSKKNSVS